MQKFEIPLSIRNGAGRTTSLVSVRAENLADANRMALAEAARLGHKRVELFMQPRAVIDSKIDASDAQELARCAVERAELVAATRRLNERVKAASGGRPHNQACMLGGMFTGLAATASGLACWCGFADGPASVAPAAEREQPADDYEFPEGVCRYCGNGNVICSCH